MRQIKFRAWVKSGDYSEMLSNVQNHIGAATGFGHLIQGTAKGIDESHVMQFTGLTDINGVEIYEGDILKSAIGLLWLVSFGSRGGFVAHEKNDIDDFVLLDDYNFTIIGNIHQNPELLK